MAIRTRLNFIYRIIILPVASFLPVVSCQIGSSGSDRLADRGEYTILISEFRNNSPEPLKSYYEGFQHGFPSMILTDLHRTGRFSPVSDRDRRKAIRELAVRSSGLTSEEEDISPGKLAGADWILSGDFIVYSGKITINARIVDVGTGLTKSSITIQTPLESILYPPEASAVKRTSLGLISGMGIPVDESLRKKVLSGIETRSINAALSNYRGEMIVDKLEGIKARAKATDRIPDHNAIERLRKSAEVNFRKALQADENYERARRNLQRLTGLLPPPL